MALVQDPEYKSIKRKEDSQAFKARQKKEGETTQRIDYSWKDVTTVSSKPTTSSTQEKSYYDYSVDPNISISQSQPTYKPITDTSGKLVGVEDREAQQTYYINPNITTQKQLDFAEGIKEQQREQSKQEKYLTQGTITAAEKKSPLSTSVGIQQRLTEKAKMFEQRADTSIGIKSMWWQTAAGTTSFASGVVGVTTFIPENLRFKTYKPGDQIGPTPLNLDFSSRDAFKTSFKKEVSGRYENLMATGYEIGKEIKTTPTTFIAGTAPYFIAPAAARRKIKTNKVEVTRAEKLFRYKSPKGKPTKVVFSATTRVVDKRFVPKDVAKPKYFLVEYKQETFKPAGKLTAAQKSKGLAVIRVSPKAKENIMLFPISTKQDYGFLETYKGVKPPKIKLTARQGTLYTTQNIKSFTRLQIKKTDFLGASPKYTTSPYKYAKYLEKKGELDIIYKKNLNTVRTKKGTDILGIYAKKNSFLDLKTKNTIYTYYNPTKDTIFIKEGLPKTKVQQMFTKKGISYGFKIRKPMEKEVLQHELIHKVTPQYSEVGVTDLQSKKINYQIGIDIKKYPYVSAKDVKVKGYSRVVPKQYREVTKLYKPDPYQKGMVAGKGQLVVELKPKMPEPPKPTIIKPTKTKQFDWLKEIDLTKNTIKEVHSYKGASIQIFPEPKPKKLSVISQKSASYSGGSISSYSLSSADFKTPIISVEDVYYQQPPYIQSFPSIEQPGLTGVKQQQFTIIEPKVTLKQPTISMQYQEPTTKQSSLIKPILNIKEISKGRQSTKAILNVKPIQVSKPILAFDQIQIQNPVLEVAQVQKQKQIPFVQTPPTTKTPFKFPFFKKPPYKSIKPMPKKSYSFITKYKPTAYSASLDIRRSPSLKASKTGLSIRPVPFDDKEIKKKYKRLRL